LSNFHIEQEIVSFTDSKPDHALFRKKGEIVSVTKIMYCPMCGDQKVNVNNRPFTDYDPNIPNHIFVCRCEYRMNVGNIGWASGRHFAPLQTASEESDMEESIKEALEKPLFA